MKQTFIKAMIVLFALSIASGLLLIASPPDRPMSIWARCVAVFLDVMLLVWAVVTWERERDGR